MSLLSFTQITNYLKFDNRWQVIVERVFFRKTGLQVLRYNGLDILLDHRADDAGSIIRCLCQDMYRPLLADLPKDKPLNVLDVGANAGGFSLLVLSELQVAKLVAIELNPNTTHRARFNIESACPNATAINAAVTCDGRALDLMLGRGSTSDNITIGTYGHGQPYSVPGITLADAVSLFSEHIDLCKIDIEGAESEVLLKGETSPLENIDRLIIELHHRKDLLAICEVLRSHGLRAVQGPDCGVNLFVRSVGVVGQTIFRQDTSSAALAPHRSHNLDNATRH